MNMISRAFAKFIQRKRVFCEANASCLCEGTHVVEYPDKSIHLYCDKHVTNNYANNNNKSSLH